MPVSRRESLNSLWMVVWNLALVGKSMLLIAWSKTIIDDRRTNAQAMASCHWQISSHLNICKRTCNNESRKVMSKKNTNDKIRFVPTGTIMLDFFFSRWLLYVSNDSSFRRTRKMPAYPSFTFFWIFALDGCLDACKRTAEALLSMQWSRIQGLIGVEVHVHGGFEWVAIW